MPGNACLIEMHALYDKHHNVSLLIKRSLINNTIHVILSNMKLYENAENTAKYKVRIIKELTCIYFWT